MKSKQVMFAKRSWAKTRPTLDTCVRLLIVFLWTYVFTYSTALNNPNERTRVLQSRALVEYGQLHIGEQIQDRQGSFRIRDLYGGMHAGLFVNDVALVCHDSQQNPPHCTGKLYPAKAPGVALLGVPALGLAHGTGLIQAGPKGEKLATWVLRYGGVTWLMLLGLLLFGRILIRFGISSYNRDRLLLGAALGTGLFPYGIMFVGHALAGVALLAGWYCLVKTQTAPRTHLWLPLLAGIFSASAVLLEYHAMIGTTMLLGFALLMKERKKVLPGFLVGALIMAGLFFLLHQLMFESPFKTGHFFLMSEHNRLSQSSGFLGMGSLKLGSLGDHLFDPYMGLIPLMPWLAAGGSVGLVHLLRGGANQGISKEARLALALIVLGYLAFVMTLDQWKMMNGWSIGPRYLLPMMLPLALVAAIGWQKMILWNGWVAFGLQGLMVASMMVLTSLTVVYPQPPPSFNNPFGELAIPMLWEGYGVKNIGSALGLGGLGLLPFFFGVILAVFFVWIPRKAEQGQSRLWAKTAFSILVALLWVFALANYHPTDPDVVAHWQHFVKNTVEGASLDP